MISDIDTKSIIFINTLFMKSMPTVLQYYDGDVMFKILIVRIVIQFEIDIR